jgi:hypothetical protein
VSFRLGGRRGWSAIGLSLLFPVVVGLIAYGIAWTAGLAGFELPPRGDLVALFASFTIGVMVSLVVVSGEEIGWRGYMLTRLINAEVPRPVLVSGLIWALWHVPVVLAGGYAAGRHPSSQPPPECRDHVVRLRDRAPAAGDRAASGRRWCCTPPGTASSKDPSTGPRRVSGAMLWVGESGNPHHAGPGRCGRDLLTRTLDDHPHAAEAR